MLITRRTGLRVGSFCRRGVVQSLSKPVLASKPSAPSTQLPHLYRSFSAFSSFLLTRSMESEHRAKRPRLEDGEHATPALVRLQRAAFLSSMSRDISPPPSSRGVAGAEVLADQKTPDVKANGSPSVDPGALVKASRSKLDSSFQHDKQLAANRRDENWSFPKSTMLPSPFTLTKIRDLPPSSNVDTVSLHDILGNPLIKEAWIFNYCFDIDWMMQFFDPDVRDLVQVKIIHGSWKSEDSNKKNIDDACKRWPNVQDFKAYLPDPFGTHHSKMFVLFTHDEQAEVIIHTANMLQKDWTNMTQAVWRSGPLSEQDKKDEGELRVIGSGERFKYDLLAYLREYKKSTQTLH